MVRRTLHLVASVAAFLLVLPGTAAADDHVTVQDPVNASTESIRIRVDFRTLETPERLSVAIVGEERRVTAECVERCGQQDHRVFALPISARGGPFDSPTARHANGPVRLEVRGEGAVTGRTIDFGGAEVTFNVPGSPVSGLEARADGEQVRLSWSATPEPGVTGYRVLRTSGSGSTVADVGPSATSAVDEPGVGSHRYAIVTVRGGASGTHESTSSAVEVTLTAPEGSGGNGDDDGGDGTGDGGGGGGDDDGEAADDRDDGGPGGDPGEGGSDGATADTDAEDRPEAAPEAAAPDLGDGGPSDGHRDGPARAQPPEVSLDGGGSGIPELPRLGEVFRGELDYGAAGGDEPRDDEDDEVVIAAPGRSDGSFLGALSDPDRVAVPIAGGLLLMAIGLHLWRWRKVSRH